MNLLLLGRKTTLRADDVDASNVRPTRCDEDVDSVSLAVGGIGFLGGGLLLMSLWAKHPVWGFVLGAVLGSHAATIVNAGIASVKKGGDE